MKRLVMFSVLFAMMLSNSAMSADIRIAVVDVAAAVKAHPRAKSNDDLLKDEVAEFESVQKGMLDEIEKLRDEFKEVRDSSRNTALNDKAREKLSLKAEEKYIELKQFEQMAREKVVKRQKELNDQQLRMQKRLIGSVAAIIKKYAKEKGFSLVLNSSEGLAGVGEVVYSSEKLDITGDIIKLVAQDK